jgi:hypothetical protein
MQCFYRIRRRGLITAGSSRTIIVRPLGQPAPDNSAVTVAGLLVVLRGSHAYTVNREHCRNGSRIKPASTLSGLRVEIMNMLYKERKRDLVTWEMRGNHVTMVC